MNEEGIPVAPDWYRGLGLREERVKSRALPSLTRVLTLAFAERCRREYQYTLCYVKYVRTRMHDATRRKEVDNHREGEQKKEEVVRETVVAPSSF